MKKPMAIWMAVAAGLSWASTAWAEDPMAPAVGELMAGEPAVSLEEVKTMMAQEREAFVEQAQTVEQTIEQRGVLERVEGEPDLGAASQAPEEELSGGSEVGPISVDGEQQPEETTENDMKVVSGTYSLGVGNPAFGVPRPGNTRWELTVEFRNAKGQVIYTMGGETSVPNGYRPDGTSGSLSVGDGFTVSPAPFGGSLASISADPTTPYSKTVEMNSHLRGRKYCFEFGLLGQVGGGTPYPFGSINFTRPDWAKKWKKAISDQE